MCLYIKIKQRGEVMIELKGIVKEYTLAEEKLKALNNISLTFRDSEFVSILGPSGCGKTTLLNIIGGLDKFTAGELLIDNKTTMGFKEKEWDSYRNSSVGFVFQNYNLIPHLSILENVTMALSLSGISTKEAKQRAIKALKEVELEKHIKKRPNQLSGGQMQRVAIARAIVNNPKILLADEPTGALDTDTSVKIMELIKKISKNMLVIMVTHNPELAEKYSDRIINILDGQIMGDSNPYKFVKSKKQTEEKLETTKTTMPYTTALKSSFKNLSNKKGRTIMTSIAGSIGIIGIAIVLAISNGMTAFITQTEREVLASSAVEITENVMIQTGVNQEQVIKDTYPDDLIFHPTKEEQSRVEMHTNNLSAEFLAYIDAMPENLYNSITYENRTNLNLINYDGVTYKDISSLSGYTNVMSNDVEYVKTQYDKLAGEYPTNKNEILLVASSDNEINPEILTALGLTGEDINSTDLIGKTIRSASNNDYYHKDGELYRASASQTELEASYNNATELKVVGILRAKQEATSNILTHSIIYTQEFIDEQVALNSVSDIVIDQKAEATKSVIDGELFIKSTQEQELRSLGAYTFPSAIKIYPAGFDESESIKVYLDDYNIGKAESDQVIYSVNFIEMMLESLGTMIDAISLLLTAFAAISLVVSSLMIGIITYVSVVERTKEIGILRAMGARKKDIGRIFNAESLIIGFFAGALGVVTTVLISLVATPIISGLVGATFVVSLGAIQGLTLLLLSMGLTFIAGLIPSRIASKKDPIIALRSE